MTVLLMFNTADSYTIQEISDATKIKLEILVQVGTQYAINTFSISSSSSYHCIFQVVGILMKPNLLQSTEAASALTPESRINLFLNYKNKKVRLNLNQPLRTEVRREQEQTLASVEEDRHHLIQACIVRTMKMRKVMQHQPLLAEVMKQLGAHFQPSVPMIKVL
jgi:cullin 1